MKNLYLRTSVALACAIGLAGCGGDDGNLLMRVTINGLTKEGLTLKINGGPALPVTKNVSYFDFPDLFPADTAYKIEVVSSPTNAKCDIYEGSGKTGIYSPNSIIVVCIPYTYDLGGSVTGLTSSGLMLLNGSVRKEIPANASSFKMTTYDAAGKPVSGQVADGATYGLTIFQQPTANTCTILQGVGTMGSAAIDNVKIICN